MSLEQVGFEVFPTLENANLRKTKAHIKKFLKKVKKAKKQGKQVTVVVYYAGYGMGYQGENYIVPIDYKIGEEEDIPINAYSLSDLDNQLKKVGSQTNIIFFDAAYASYDNSGRAHFGVSIVEQPLSNGTFFGFAAQPSELAQNSKTSDINPFVNALMNGIPTTKEEVMSFFQGISYDVETATQGKQQPWSINGLKDDFYFENPNGDADGDGVLNKDDECDTEKGSKENKGCPMHTEEFVFVQGGTFEMGNEDGDEDARTVHTVRVNDFYMNKYETTVGEFRTFVKATGYITDAEKEGKSQNWGGSDWIAAEGINWQYSPSGALAKDNHPVIYVSWNDAKAYCTWKTKITGKKYRLATEAEWEFAGRSRGKDYEYAWGNGAPNGNVGDISRRGVTEEDIEDDIFGNEDIYKKYNDGYKYTAPVGSFSPNDIGLYDMTGNVWEWCEDFYGETYYAESPIDNPLGPEDGTGHAIRGGSWSNNSKLTRITNRSMTSSLTVNNYHIGFRVVREYH
jgi:formylglycine-generating enzyme required for sulfatase activity